MSTLLCALDYSPPSEAAFARALDLLAADPDAVLHVVHVREQPDVRPGTGLDGLVVTEEQRLQTYVSTALARRGGRLDARVTAKVVAGVGAAAQIARAAKELQADLVIIATHGRTGLQRLMLGSVAESVVRTAPCSVLVVRPRAVAEQGGGA